MKNEDLKQKKNLSFLFNRILFNLVIFGFLVAILFSFFNNKSQYLEITKQNLSNVASIKVNAIVEWRKERLNSVQAIQKNPNISPLLQRIIVNPNDLDAQKEILIHFSAIQNIHLYDILFLDLSGHSVFSFPFNAETTSHLEKPLSEVKQTKQITFVDLHQVPGKKQIFMCLLVPIFENKTNQEIVGFVYLHIDPNIYLYPFLKQWPTDSRTAETVLVRKNEENVQFLNELRFQQNTALTLLLPLTRTENPAVQAVLGKIGFTSGFDYRGVPVFAILSQIPDSPWFLVSRIDQEEVFEVIISKFIQQLLWLIVFAILLGILLIFFQKRQNAIIKNAQIIQEDQKKRSKQFEDASLYSRSLIEASFDCLVTISKIGTITDLNEAFIKATGVSRLEIIGTDFSLYFTDPVKAKEILQQVIEKGFVTDNPLIIRHKNGSMIDVLYNAKVYRDKAGNVEGVFTSARDVTKQHSMEQALMKSKKLLDETGRLARIGGWEIDLIANTLYWSDTTYQIHEVDPGFVLNLETGINFFAPEAIPVISKCIEQAFKLGEPFDVELQLITAKNNRLWVRNIGEVYKENDKIVKIGGVFQDINQRKLLEQDREALLKKITKDAELLTASYEEMESFSYSVSHDLRSPLRHISGYIELLVSRFSASLPEKAKQYISSIEDASRNMGSLIDDLLLFSRTGRQEMKFTDLDMNNILKEVIEPIKADNLERNIKWDIANLPHIYGDRSMFLLVFTNLIGNAIKFTKPREQAIIDIRAREEENEYIFSVTDNGVGFDMQYAGKLFGVFQRLHPIDEFEGTGIGLATVRRIISKHGGRTWAEAELDKGATFYFSLPKKSGNN